MIWQLTTRTAKSRDRARLPVSKVITKLRFFMGGEHTLRGEHGRRILTSIAAQWNTHGRDCPDVSPRCRADYSTEAARKTFTLSITR